jgi:plasmid stabilization system protein ParE
MRLTWSPRARGDIDAIHDWVRQHSETGATCVVAEIRKTAELIARHPGIGRSTDRPPIRVLHVVRFPYLIYFMVVTDEVVILHVRHGARGNPDLGDLQR